MKASDLTYEQFLAWRIKRGMSVSACARALGISSSSVNLYEAGTRDGRPVWIPLTVCLAMAALENNLEPYNGEINDSDTSNTSS